MKWSPQTGHGSPALFRKGLSLQLMAQFSLFLAISVSGPIASKCQGEPQYSNTSQHAPSHLDAKISTRMGLHGQHLSGHTPPIQMARSQPGWVDTVNTSQHAPLPFQMPKSQPRWAYTIKSLCCCSSHPSSTLSPLHERVLILPRTFYVLSIGLSVHFGSKKLKPTVPLKCFSTQTKIQLAHKERTLNCSPILDCKGKNEKKPTNKGYLSKEKVYCHPR